MEGAINNSTSVQSAVANPTTPPPIAPITPSVEAPTTPMPTTTPNVQLAEGGSTSSDGGANSFLKSLNWIEIGFTILGLTALIYTIHYYKFKSKEDKMVNNELQRQIDEIKMNLQTSLKGKYKSI